jgi:flagellar motor component MotA
MLEYVLGVLVVLSATISTFMIMRNLKIVSNLLGFEQKEIAKMTNDNLNNVAGALIGLSELLEEADQVIDEISRVPTVGDILQQAVQGFIMQKMAPMIPGPMQEPMQDIINDRISQATHGKEKRTVEVQETTTEI